MEGFCVGWVWELLFFQDTVELELGVGQAPLVSSRPPSATRFSTAGNHRRADQEASQVYWRCSAGILQPSNDDRHHSMHYRRRGIRKRRPVPYGTLRLAQEFGMVVRNGSNNRQVGFAEGSAAARLKRWAVAPRRGGQPPLPRSDCRSLRQDCPREKQRRPHTPNQPKERTRQQEPHCGDRIGTAWRKEASTALPFSHVPPSASPGVAWPVAAAVASPERRFAATGDS